MPGVTTAYQTGVHGSRPANGAGCVLYSCTTHSLVYRDDGTSWITFMTLAAGAYAPGGTDVAVADGGTGASTASGARTNLGLVIGTDVQAQDAELAAIAGLTSAADKGIQFTGSGTAATYDLTTAGKALLDDANAAAQRTTLGISAANTPFTPNGSIAATDVQTAIQEVRDEAAGGGATDIVQTLSGAGSVRIPRMVFDPDIPPASPDTDDQEFDSALSGWTTRGTLDTSNANSTLPSNLYIARVSGATGINGLDRSFSSSRPKTITAKFTAASGGGNYHNHMIYLTDGTAYEAWGVVNEATDTLYERSHWSNRTTRSSQTDSGAQDILSGMGPLWLRIVLTTDTNVAFFASHNGITYWQFQASVNPGFTCSNVGVGFNDFASSAAMKLYLDSLRFS